jgi:hypothetical protein
VAKKRLVEKRNRAVKRKINKLEKEGITRSLLLKPEDRIEESNGG